MTPKITPVQSLILETLRRDPAAFLALLPGRRGATLWSGRAYLQYVSTAALAKFLRLGLLQEAPAPLPFTRVYRWAGRMAPPKAPRQGE